MPMKQSTRTCVCLYVCGHVCVRVCECETSPLGSSIQAAGKEG